MPGHHDSITRCERCDVLYSADLKTWCAECGTDIGPCCAKTSTDSDLSVCSSRCYKLFMHRMKQADSGYICEAPGCDRICTNSQPFLTITGRKMCRQCALIYDVLFANIPDGI